MTPEERDRLMVEAVYRNLRRDVAMMVVCVVGVVVCVVVMVML